MWWSKWGKAYLGLVNHLREPLDYGAQAGWGVGGEGGVVAA